MVIPPFCAEARSKRLCSLGQSVLRGESAQGHIWLVVIVFSDPLIGEHQNFLQIVPVML
jgi:hypothetical protein